MDHHHSAVEVDVDGQALLQTSLGNAVTVDDEQSLPLEGLSFKASCEDFLAAFNAAAEQDVGEDEETLAGMCASLAPPAACRAAAEGPLLARPWTPEAMSDACSLLGDAMRSSPVAAEASTGSALSLMGAGDQQPQPGDLAPGPPFATGAMNPPDLLHPNVSGGAPDHHVYNETIANQSALAAAIANATANATDNATNATTTAAAPSLASGNTTDSNASNATTTTTTTVHPYAYNATLVTDASDIVLDHPIIACEDAINGSNASVMCTTTTTTPPPNATNATTTTTTITPAAAPSSSNATAAPAAAAATAAA